jgi:hypothetical protein
MNTRNCVFALFVTALLIGSSAHAQATRTWVSGVGDDVNPCSRTAPCKTFAGAISKTAAGGEISVLDPGSYGAITITKSITISGIGQLSGILGSGVTAVTVNAAATDVIILRDLQINGAGTGLNGIRFLAGAALHVENCSINGFKSASAGSGHGINFAPSGASQLFVKDTAIQNNGTGSNGGGILIIPGVGGSAKASLDNVRMDQNVFGLKVQDNSTVTLRDSVSAGNAFSGITATSVSGGAVNLFLDNVASVNNGTTGILSNGAVATVRVSNSTITGNATSVQSTASGAILSYDNNNIDGNTTNTAPTGLLNQQ